MSPEIAVEEARFRENYGEGDPMTVFKAGASGQLRRISEKKEEEILLGLWRPQPRGRSRGPREGARV